MPQFRTQLRATGTVTVSGDGCHVNLAGGDILQIFTVGPYINLTDPADFMQPLTIDGLQARTFAFTGTGHGECAIDINYRAFDSTEINAWNPDKALDATGRAARCHESETAAQDIVKQFVPLAGGTPAATVQVPVAAAVTGQTACQIVQSGSTGFTDIEDQNPVKGSNFLGSTCRYTDPGGSLAVVVTSSPTPLASLPSQLPGSVITQRKLGPLSARTEQTPTACAEEVGLPTGQTLAITYQPKLAGAAWLAPGACYAAQAVAASAMADLVDESGG
jgi:hypothetical protein